MPSRTLQVLAQLTGDAPEFELSCLASSTLTRDRAGMHAAPRIEHCRKTWLFCRDARYTEIEIDSREL